MAKDLERHNINLSRQVWGELRLRSVQESTSASELVAYVVEKFVDEHAQGSAQRLHISRYQPRSPDEDRLGRTVFFPAEVWKKAQWLAAQNGTSIAGLIDYLLRRYLGLLPEAEENAPPTITYTKAEDAPRGEVVRIGEERVYLGENPVRIDLKTGKRIQD